RPRSSPTKRDGPGDWAAAAYLGRAPGDAPREAGRARSAIGSGPSDRSEGGRWAKSAARRRSSSKTWSGASRSGAGVATGMLAAALSSCRRHGTSAIAVAHASSPERQGEGLPDRDSPERGYGGLPHRDSPERGYGGLPHRDGPERGHRGLPHRDGPEWG